LRQVRWAEDDDLMAAGGVLARQEVAAELRRDAEQGEEVGRAAAGEGEFGGLARVGKADTVGGEGGKVAVGLARLPQVEKVGGRVAALRLLRGDAVDMLQAARVGVGQGLQHDPVDEAEHRGVGADAKAERQDGGEGEAGGLHEGADAEAEIEQQVLQPPPAAALAGLLLQAGDVAELPLGGVARLLRGQAVGLPVGRALLEVETHLLGHVAFEPRFAEKRAEGAGEAVEGIHGGET
jgi:hypothetical protein